MQHIRTAANRCHYNVSCRWIIFNANTICILNMLHASSFTLPKVHPSSILFIPHSSWMFSANLSRTLSKWGGRTICRVRWWQSNEVKDANGPINLNFLFYPDCAIISILGLKWMDSFALSRLCFQSRTNFYSNIFLGVYPYRDTEQL